MANVHGDIALEVSIDDLRREAHSTYAWGGGGMVLMISTVLPERALAVELISTYVGHPQTCTIVTHLMLGPVGRAPEIHADEHDHEQLDPIEGARGCAYDHARQLTESLRAVGYEASVQPDESAFDDLERIE